MSQHTHVRLRRPSQRGVLSKIVIIDDDETIRLTFKDALEQAGHLVQVAANGREGLLLCGDVEPDLVITDVVMPEQDGFTTMSRLRSLMPDVPVIAMSVHDGQIEQDHALRCGAKRFLSKPVTPDELVEAADDLLKAG